MAKFPKNSVLTVNVNVDGTMKVTTYSNPSEVNAEAFAREVAAAALKNKMFKPFRRKYEGLFTRNSVASAPAVEPVVADPAPQPVVVNPPMSATPRLRPNARRVSPPVASAGKRIVKEGRRTFEVDGRGLRRLIAWEVRGFVRDSGGVRTEVRPQVRTRRKKCVG